ncbi:phosphatidylglycerophosphatase A family protein [Pseudogemmobacter faecipullorum]|uniref:phosphatidylglycerophosphatase A family protein n=1 Tax=Pseudogemmobacter faecipullorum TaxID=2755041 RepID=UPI001D002A69|nr:phosphatidylglycerophosphatase A [Pseudogemmobacter faecipullorum]
MIARLIATFGYIGHLRPASGTWASLAAVLIGLAVFQTGHGWLIPVMALLATLTGFWAVPLYLGADRSADPSEVVIDEVAGQWIAMSFTAIPLWNHGLEMGLISGAWPGWVAPFLLFRLYDITKPGLVGWADRRHDPVGVMLDDIIAGIFAGLTAMVLAGLYHGVLQPWLS